MTISPQGVAYEIVSGGDAERTPEGLVPHEVRFWDTAARQRDGLGKHRITAIDGDRASDLMNSFLMQIRTNHQRVVALSGDAQFPEGYTRHVSGLAIPNKVVADAEALATFLTGKGLPLGGYEPFMFPNYAGELEPLNGMWQHELHTVPLLEQAEANKNISAVLNFEGVNYLNSSNIAKLLKLRKKLLANRGKMVICGINTNVWGLFLVTGLDKVFEFSESVATGLAGVQLSTDK